MVSIDIPLDERPERVLELEKVQRRLWEAMRDEARAADRELSDAG